MNKMRKKGFAGYSWEEVIKIPIMVVIVQLMFLAFASLKGKGTYFFQIMQVLVPATLIVYALVLWCRGNLNIVLISMTLLTVGFMLQMVSMDLTDATPAEINVYFTHMKLKFILALAAALCVALVFYFFGYLLTYDMTAVTLISLQLVLYILMLFFGQDVGDSATQSAAIVLKIGPLSIQIWEVVKLIYIFVMSILLCKDEKADAVFWKLPRETVAIIYSFVTWGAFVIYREFGTLLILAIVGIMMLSVYGNNRAVIKRGLILIGVLALFGGIACLLLHNYIPPLQKIYLRFAAMLNPGADRTGSGYQNILSRQAIAVGGALGPDTFRYMFTIPNETSDMVFSKLVQCCGTVMAAVVIGLYTLMLLVGKSITDSLSDNLYKGMATGITLVMVVQAMIHIGYNIGIAPITGINLLFVSSGFTSILVSMIMVAILLVISTGRLERSKYDEKNTMEKMASSKLGFQGRRRRAS